MPPWSSLLQAESSLVARRRHQRAAPTFGDDADQALLAALSGLPPEAEEAARASGRRLGADVYARRFVEDTLPHAVTVLSGSLESSGLGALSLRLYFHRSARIAFAPAIGMAGAHRVVADGFVAGALEGFFSAAFNCDAQARAMPDAIELELGDGRDVNSKGAAA